MTQAAIGGPAQTTYRVTDRALVTGRDAQRVFVVADGRPQEGGPQQAVYYVSDAEIAAGDFVISGNKPIPIIEVGAAGAEYPPQAVYVVTVNSESDFPPQPVPDIIGDALRADAVAYYRFENVGEDATGHNYTLTKFGVGTPASMTGKIGAALANSKDPNVPLVSSDAIFSVAETNYTFTCWIYRSDNTFQLGILSKEDGDLYTDEYVLNVEQTINRLQFWCSIGNGGDYKIVNADSYGNVPLNEWIFIRAWFDLPALSLNIQVNNGAIDTLAIGSAPDVNLAAFTVGTLSSNAWIGGIDELGFWRRILSSDEAAYLYNSGAGRALFP